MGAHRWGNESLRRFEGLELEKGNPPGIAPAGTARLRYWEGSQVSLVAEAQISANGDNWHGVIGRGLIDNSPPEYAASGVPAVTVPAGNFTIGNAFYCTKQMQCAGVRFWWAGGPRTIRCKLWNAANVQLATVDLAVAGGGAFGVALFAAPITLTPYALYRISMYETLGAFYTLIAALPVWTIATTTPVIAGPGVYWLSPYTFVAGDACPLGVAADTALLEPVLVTV